LLVEGSPEEWTRGVVNRGEDSYRYGMDLMRHLRDERRLGMDLDWEAVRVH